MKWGSLDGANLVVVELRSRRQNQTIAGRPIDPRSPQPQALASASLIVGASIFFLCPTFSPLTIALGPIALLLGNRDLANAKARNEPQSLAGTIGRSIGRVATAIVLVLLGFVALVMVISSL